MKKRLIDMAVIIAMAIVANYPLYSSLRAAAEKVDVVLQTVQAEIISWQEEVSVIQARIDVLGGEFKSVIDGNLAQADSVLSEIKSLKLETGALNNKIEALKSQAIDKVEAKVENEVKRYIPGLPGF